MGRVRGGGAVELYRTATRSAKRFFAGFLYVSLGGVDTGGDAIGLWLGWVERGATPLMHRLRVLETMLSVTRFLVPVEKGGGLSVIARLAITGLLIGI